MWEIFQAKVLHHWSVNAHLLDWKWKETVLRNTQFSPWGQKKSSDRWKLVTFFFFHLDRIIAWLNEVATVAHNNSSRRLGKKITELLPQSYTLNENINSKLSLRDLDEKMTSAR